METTVIKKKSLAELPAKERVLIQLENKTKAAVNFSQGLQNLAEESHKLSDNAQLTLLRLIEKVTG